jgi:hypothetical protein
MRITDNAAMMRTPELAGDHARNIRQTGLTAGTLNEIVQDTEEEMQQVRDKDEIEDGRVRADSESDNGTGGEQAQRDRGGEAALDEDEKLRRRASEDLLNLPVTKSKGSETETRRFDVRV